MDSNQDYQEVPHLTEETGDSEAILELKSYHDDYDDDGNYDYDDDDRESCNGGCNFNGVSDDYDDDEDEAEEEMTWSTWVTTARSERRKRGEEEEERSPAVVDEEENRLFWEACLASGFP
ncbi:uncharacterized protein A4U43_C05F1170 [Asparagus officinalis]|uniref:Uncharacterized protein n=1 Tax=Asparagus officinalis TaxID=4686 RepID=A0A5P1EQZ9_ASPOF|nr:prostatic spermine-binding protein [Asparagus officinalis]ONK67547.1 uncharacterized protein A4U43_C05F1170 [Asparagus officinalis]